MKKVRDLVKQRIKESGLLWDYFYKISQIPRGSFNSKAISDYIKEESKNLGLIFTEDNIGNICVKVPATKRFSYGETIIFQAHTDMVCEKNAGTTHNFKTDSIQWQIKGDRLYAQETTLGSDNGIGVATILALMADKSLSHPSLECLFTIDEEVGLIGAQKIDPNQLGLKGRFLINLDSEDEGVFCIGCAGGINSFINKKEIDFQIKQKGFLTTLQVQGLSGGHSGTEIHKGLGNANFLMMKLIRYLLETGRKFSLVMLSGGDKSNVIPRECEAILWSESFLKISSLLLSLEKEFKNDLKRGQDEAFSLKFSEKELEKSIKVLSEEDTKNLVKAFSQIPHGIQKMYSETLVGTSLNFASIHLQPTEGIKVVLSHRSIWKSDLLPEIYFSGLQKTFKELGFTWSLGEGYPPWEPAEKSLLSDYCVKVWEKLFGTRPMRQVIHAGLECGAIRSVVSAKQGRELDVLSFGPTIRGAHTPEEYVEISTVERYWVFISSLLSSCDGIL